MNIFLGIVMLIIALVLAKYHTKVLQAPPFMRPEISNHPLFSLGITIVYIGLGVLGLFLVFS